MNGKFIPAADMERDHPDRGVMGWASRPATTGAKQLVVIEVTLEPGYGHNFHKHPQQEEVIYVVAGAVEQWIERDHRVLKSGDSVFIAADVVHASFNTGRETAKLIAILGPSVGEAGYELEEVYDQEPWRSLR